MWLLGCMQAEFEDANALGVEDIKAALRAVQQGLPARGPPAAVQAVEGRPGSVAAGRSVAKGEVAQDSGGQPVASQSALQPQYAIITGSVPAGGGEATAEVPAAVDGEAPPLLPAEPELSSSSPAEPGPPRHYQLVREELAQCLLQPGGVGVSWDAFPNYLGEGAKSRLLSLATLHLTPAGIRCPPAVRELAANSNRMLLGAAVNCELFQERVARWVERGGCEWAWLRLRCELPSPKHVRRVLCQELDAVWGTARS